MAPKKKPSKQSKKKREDKDDRGIRHKSFTAHMRELDINVNRQTEFVEYEDDGILYHDGGFSCTFESKANGGGVMPDNNNLASTTSAKQKARTLEETYFNDQIRKHRSNNLSVEWQTCASAVHSKIESLPSLLLNLEDIIDIFFAHTTHHDSIEPVCQCIGAGLARDVRSEIVPFLPKIFENLYELLVRFSSETNEKAEQPINHIFQCISYIFKYLHSYICKDLKKYLKLFLGKYIIVKPYFLRQFIGETIAYLVVKSQSLKDQQITGVTALFDVLEDKEFIFSLLKDDRADLVESLTGHSAMLGESKSTAEVHSSDEEGDDDAMDVDEPVAKEDSAEKEDGDHASDANKSKLPSVSNDKHRRLLARFRQLVLGLTDTTSIVLFESMKSINGRFRLDARNIFGQCLDRLAGVQAESSSESEDMVVEVSSKKEEKVVEVSTKKEEKFVEVSTKEEPSKKHNLDKKEDASAIATCNKEHESLPELGSLKYYAVKICMQRLFDYLDGNFFGETELSEDFLESFSDSMSPGNDRMFFWHLDVLSSCYRTYFKKGKWVSTDYPVEARKFIEKALKMLAERKKSWIIPNDAPNNKETIVAGDGLLNISDINEIVGIQAYPPIEGDVQRTKESATDRFVALMIKFGFANEVVQSRYISETKLGADVWNFISTLQVTLFSDGEAADRRLENEEIGTILRDYNYDGKVEIFNHLWHQLMYLQDHVSGTFELQGFLYVAQQMTKFTGFRAAEFLANTWRMISEDWEERQEEVSIRLEILLTYGRHCYNGENDWMADNQVDFEELFEKAIEFDEDAAEDKLVWHTMMSQVAELYGVQVMLKFPDQEFAAKKEDVGSIVTNYADFITESASSENVVCLLESMNSILQRMKCVFNETTHGVDFSDVVLEVLTSSMGEKLRNDFLMKIVSFLNESDPRKRTLTLRLLKLLPAEYLRTAVKVTQNMEPETSADFVVSVERYYTNKNTTLDSVVEEVITTCLQMEETELSIQTERHRTQKMTALVDLLLKKRLEGKLVGIVVIQILISQFHLRFSPLWKPAMERLAVLVGADIEVFGPSLEIDAILEKEDSSGLSEKPTKKRKKCKSVYSKSIGTSTQVTTDWWRKTIWTLLTSNVDNMVKHFLTTADKSQVEEAADHEENDKDDDGKSSKPGKKKAATDDKAGKQNASFGSHKKSAQKDIRNLDVEELTAGSCLWQKIVYNADEEDACILSNIAPFWTTNSANSFSNNTLIRHGLVWQAVTKVVVQVAGGNLTKGANGETGKSEGTGVRILDKKMSESMYEWVLKMGVLFLDKFYKNGQTIPSARTLCKDALTAVHSSLEGSGSLEAAIGSANEDAIQWVQDLTFGVEHWMMVSEDSAMQQLGLKLLTKSDKFSFLNPYVDNLNRLSDDKKFRGELTGVTLDYSCLSEEELKKGVHAGSNRKLFPQPAHRKLILPVLLRILFSKFTKKSRSIDKHGSRETRRRAVFQLLNGLNQEELAELVLILMEGLLCEVQIEDGAFEMVKSLLNGLTVKMPNCSNGSIRSQREQVRLLRSFLVTANFEANVWGKLMLNATEKTQVCVWQVAKAAVKGFENDRLLTLNCAEAEKRFAPFLTTASDVLTQLDRMISPFTQFLMDSFVSVMAQTDLNKQIILCKSDVDVKKLSLYERQILRFGVQRIHDLMVRFPYADSAISWVRSLQRIAPLFKYLVQQVPKAGGNDLSAMAKLLTSLGQWPDLWVLFDTFPEILDSCFSVFDCNPVIARVKSTTIGGDITGGILVKKVTELGLRLCRGSVLSWKQYEKETISYERHARKKKNDAKDTRANFEQNQFSKRMNQFGDHENMDEDDMREEQLQAMRMTEEEHQVYVKRGVALIKPRVERICDGLEQLILQRKNAKAATNGGNINPAKPVKGKKQRNDSRNANIVLAEELDLILAMSDLIEDHQSARKLSDLLLHVLFDVGFATSNAESAILVLEVLSKLIPIYVSSGDADIKTFLDETLTKLEQLLRPMHNFKDITVRRKLCELMVAVVDSLDMHESIQTGKEKKKTLPEFTKYIHDESLEVVYLAYKRVNPNEDINEYIAEWALGKEGNKLTRRNITRAICALNWTKKAATVEPDLDMHVTMLSVLRNRDVLLNESSAPAAVVPALLNHMNFMLTQGACDSLLRKEVELTYEQLTKRMEGVVSRAMESMKTETTDAMEKDNIFEIMYVSGLPQIRKNLKSTEVHVVSSSLRIIRNLFMPFHDLKENDLLILLAKDFGTDASNMILPLSWKLHLLGLFLDFFRTTEATETTVIERGRESITIKSFRGYLEWKAGQHASRVSGEEQSMKTESFDEFLEKVLFGLKPEVDIEKGMENITLTDFCLSSASCNFLYLDLAVCFANQSATPGDVDAGDVLENLVHLQKHRRGRALTSIAAQSKHLQKSTLEHVVVPLCVQAVLQKESSREAYDPNLANQGIQGLAMAYAHIGKWSAVVALLRYLGKALKEFGKSREKLIIKTIVHVLGAYKFPMEDDPNTTINVDTKKKTSGHIASLYKNANFNCGEATNALLKKIEEICPRKKEGEDEEDEEEAKECAAEEGKVSKTEEPEENDDERKEEQEAVRRNISISLKQNVVPMLKKLLWEKTQEDKDDAAKDPKSIQGRNGKKNPPGLVRLPIVGCLMHILPFLTEKDFYSELPRLIGQLCDGLRSRLIANRDASRKALQQCVIALGPAWFVYIIRELQNALNKGGYMSAVCVFSIHSALNSLVDEFYGKKTESAQWRESGKGAANIGELDGAVGEFRNALEMELDRIADPDRAEEEAADRKGQCMEARKIRGPEIVQLLAQICSPEIILSELMEFIYELLLKERVPFGLSAGAASRAYSQKFVNRVRDLMSSCLQGLMKNPNFDVNFKTHVTEKTLLHTVNLLRERKTGKTASNKLNLTSDGDTEEKTTTENSACWSDKKERAYTVQSGAASGKQTYKTLGRQHKGFDAASRAGVLGTVGLKLLTHMLKTKLFSFNKETEADQEQDIMKKLDTSIVPLVVECFTSNQDALFVGSAKCLHRLQSVTPDSFDDQNNGSIGESGGKKEQNRGRAIAMQILKTFQQVSAQQDLSSRLLKNRSANTELIPCLTQLLSSLLAKGRTAAWFLEMVGEDEKQQKSKGQMGACIIGYQHQTDAKRRKMETSNNHKDAAQYAIMTSENAFFFEALLSQIVVSLGLPRLRQSALQLLKRVLARAGQKLQKHAQVYHCLDSVGELVVTGGYTDDVTSALCGQLYCDFLLDFPHEKHGFQKRIEKLIGNINAKDLYARKSVVNCINTIVSMLPIEEVKNQADVLFVTIGTRLACEKDSGVRNMILFFIKNLLKRLSNGSGNIGDNKEGPIVLFRLFDLIPKFHKIGKVNSAFAELIGVFNEVAEDMEEKNKKKVEGLCMHNLASLLEEGKSMMENADFARSSRLLYSVSTSFEKSIPSIKLTSKADANAVATNLKLLCNGEEGIVSTSSIQLSGNSEIRDFSRLYSFVLGRGFGIDCNQIETSPWVIACGLRVLADETFLNEQLIPMISYVQKNSSGKNHEELCDFLWYKDQIVRLLVSDDLETHISLSVLATKALCKLLLKMQDHSELVKYRFGKDEEVEEVVEDVEDEEAQKLIKREEENHDEDTVDPTKTDSKSSENDDDEDENTKQKTEDEMDEDERETEDAASQHALSESEDEEYDDLRAEDVKEDLTESNLLFKTQKTEEDENSPIAKSSSSTSRTTEAKQYSDDFLRLVQKTVGYLTFKGRKMLGDIRPNLVRIASIIRTLGHMSALLDLDVLKQQKVLPNMLNILMRLEQLKMGLKDDGSIAAVSVKSMQDLVNLKYKLNSDTPPLVMQISVLCEWGHDILKQLESRFSNDKNYYMDVVGEVAKEIRTKKQKRRMEARFEGVRNPAKVADKKIKKNLKKRVIAKDKKNTKLKVRKGFS